ncbi:ABC transporter ATP-binding protein [Actinoplanes sp. NPDC048967]|uniref:ABC transporter ATP-binding protein n=1 Tax=Actinoplanes sp. NPDC048967 TaxID=3155269 RepID=UPI0033C10CD6
MGAGRLPGGWRAVRISFRAAPGASCLKVLLTGVTALAPVAVAWLTKLLLDDLVTAGDAPSTTLVVAVAAAGAVSGVVPVVSHYFDTQLGRAVKTWSRTTLFAAINRLRGLARLEDPVFHDRLRLAQQAGGTGPGLVFDSLLGVAHGVVLTAGFVVALVAVNPWMAAAVLLAAGPTVVAELRLSRRRARVAMRLGHAERRDMFYQNLQLRLDAAQEVRLFGLGGFFQRRMMTELGTINAAHARLDRREMATQVVLSSAAAAVLAAGLVWTVREVAGGRLTVGDLTAFTMAAAGVQGGSSTLVNHVAAAYHSLLLLQHFDEVVEARPDLAEPAVPRRPGALSDGIRLRDVWFRYSPEHPWVLRGVDLDLPVGRTTALVGLNGAGKTTIVKLLCRFYDPDRGTVQWDGTDLRDLDLDELRSRIGAVFQEHMSYDLSAAENIGIGRLADLDRPAAIVAAARAAGVDDVVAALPKGYDTLLTRTFFDQADRDDPATGVVLSGGQWQRLALARSFMRTDPELLILDEPSAGLDPRAEHDVHVRLRARHDGAGTRLLISHRLNTVRTADHIVVLAGGRVVEQGDHESLAAGNTRYAELFRLQSAGYLPATAGSS